MVDLAAPLILRAERFLLERMRSWPKLTETE
jgi:hypothetical protein